MVMKRPDDVYKMKKTAWSAWKNMKRKIQEEDDNEDGK